MHDETMPKRRYHRNYGRILLLMTFVLLLSGCAVGRMLVSGYTPPPLIEQLEQDNDLLVDINQGVQNQRKQGAISLESYKGDAPFPLLQNRGDEQVDYRSWQTPSSLFQPSFVHKSIEDYAAQMAMELLKNSAGLKTSDLIGVGSFVRLDRSLQTTNVLGNQLSEYFISEVQQFGLSVIDFKAMNHVHVRSSGDYMFSRDSLELAQDLEMDHMLSGTMIDKPKGIQVNARIISVTNKRVVASASVLIPHFIVQRLHPQVIGHYGNMATTGGE
ncbi:hypothetical protein ISG33_03780 [Glaciecola sp. MH2013]|uniref:FlgO family outer membrane protein n=1 Tax=Glaciecola sp. MH2013 TaxID=2785524 RepID=UPI0018A1266C|nr:FlgO family outer membrane protein [Glaciecola sp. MH2013]MBF7072520.1 hypothetical protein [Glaciecola sp. MH2013]